MRRFETADPLRRHQRRPVRRAPVSAPSNLANAPGAVPRETVSAPSASAASSSTVPNSNGSPEQWKEFTLNACSTEELADSRYHIIKFQSRTKVDPAQQFTPPIRFQRKDPKNLQIIVGEEDEEEERERKNPFFKKRKTHQVLGGTDAEGEAIRKLRQEEHYPWVMEDFDGKSAWVSKYEAAQSDTYAVFVFDRYGFKMIPVEKWYRMNSRNKFASLTLEQAEERMQNKDSGANRWIMDRLQAENGVSGKGAHTIRRMRTVEGSEERGVAGEEMDYDEEFADDEEAPLLDGPEEDLKEVQERIKKEQLQATHHAIVNDADEDDLFGNDQEIDKQGKKLRRYLRSLEKNAYYDSDDESNPYASESENDSEPEIKRESDADDPNFGTGNDTPAFVVFRRKNIKNLPHGMVVIQLPPNILRNFPQGEWNPNVPRRQDPASGALSTVTASNSAVSSAAPSPPLANPGQTPSPPSSSSYSAMNTTDPTLLTSEDVREAISNRRLEIIDLIGVLKPKLKLNKENNTRLKAIVKEVAQLREGKYLVLI